MANPITRDEVSAGVVRGEQRGSDCAGRTGAEKYAPDIAAEDDAGPGERLLYRLEQENPITKLEITFARQAAQRAEDARLVTLQA